MAEKYAHKNYPKMLWRRATAEEIKAAAATTTPEVNFSTKNKARIPTWRQKFNSPEEHGEIGKEWFENPNLEIEAVPISAEAAVEAAIAVKDAEIETLKRQLAAAQAAANQAAASAKAADDDEDKPKKKGK